MNQLGQTLTSVAIVTSSTERGGWPVLTRDAWQCRECGRVCSDKREAHADHIIRIADGGGRYDLANGQTLSVRCHGRKTRAEQSACQGRVKS